jgi:hypothetical protein
MPIPAGGAGRTNVQEEAPRETTVRTGWPATREDTMADISGGMALARALNALGVGEVFTLHGGHLDSFLTACADAGIRLTDTRHEATAGHAAEAYPAPRATSGSASSPPGRASPTP